MKTSVIKTTLQRFFSQQSGIPVIFADQNAPVPYLPFMTLKVLATSLTGFSDVHDPAEDESVTIFSNQMVSVSLQAYGPGAIDAMETVRDALERETVLTALRGAGLPFIRVNGTLEDTTSAVAKRMEERAGMDLEFRASAVVIDHPGIISDFTIEGHFDQRVVMISSIPTVIPDPDMDYTASSTTIFADSTVIFADRT